MSTHIERVSSILGTLLVGIAAYLIVSGRNQNMRRRTAPVEKLAADLKEAWAPYHNP